MVTLDIFIHMDAVDRNEWQGTADDRPLTDLGKTQAERIAAELGEKPVTALFSSPAVRCRESLEPLARKFNLPLVVVPGFRDTLGYKAPQGWENPDRPTNDPLGGALSAGSAFSALREIQAQMPEGRAILCSYGDIVPALLAFIAGAHDIPMPGRNNRKGAVFTIELEGSDATMAGHEPSAGFPQ